MNLAQVNFEIGVLEGKLDAMGLNPRESDVLSLLSESEQATEIRNQITALDRVAALLRRKATHARVNPTVPFDASCS